MKVAVTGSTGFIGSALVPALIGAGHDVVRLVRRQPEEADEVRWDPASGDLDPAALAGVEAAVHLAGAGVGDKRWTASYRRQVRESRVQGTTLLARTLAGLDPRPSVLVSGSAIGFYGDTGDTLTDETGPRGGGFLAEVVDAWESSTKDAEDAGIRVCHIRTGLVLDRHGGALAPQLPVFRLGLGGRLGSGNQWQSWISLQDEIAAIVFVLETDGISGPVNLVAPEPVRQRDFAKALGRALHRPAPWIVPRFALRIAFDGFADEGLLTGQRLRPRVLQDAGFRFRQEHLDEGLRAALDS